MKTFKKGDKVKIPTANTISGYRSAGDNIAPAIREARKIGQDYLFVNLVRGDSVDVGHTEDQNLNTYLIEDLELYEEPGLPDKYIVECNNALETTAVMNSFPAYKDRNWGHWRYVVYNGERAPDGNQRVDIQNNLEIVKIYVNREEVPVYPFLEWQRLSGKAVQQESPVSYKVIKDFPGSPRAYQKDTVITPATNNDLFKQAQAWPEFFEPVYAPKEIKSSMKGANKTMEITITKEGFTGEDGRVFKIEDARVFLKGLVFEHNAPWTVVPRSFDIGCVNSVDTREFYALMEVYDKHFK